MCVTFVLRLVSCDSRVWTKNLFMNFSCIVMCCHIFGCFCDSKSAIWWTWELLVFVANLDKWMAMHSDEFPFTSTSFFNVNVNLFISYFS